MVKSHISWKIRVRTSDAGTQGHNGGGGGEVREIQCPAQFFRTLVKILALFQRI